MRADSERTLRVKNFLFEASKFSLSVVSAAVLSVWIQMRVLSSSPPSPIGSAIQASFTRHSGSRSAGSGHAIAAGPNEELSGFYAKYLDEVLKTLRSDRRVRMIKLEVPTTLLGYQRFLASQEKGASLRLQGRAASIPVIAISRGTQAYLEEMRVTYIDPKLLPAKMMEGAALGLNDATLQQYLLVPDLSGTNAHKFFFARR